MGEVLKWSPAHMGERTCRDHPPGACDSRDAHQRSQLGLSASPALYLGLGGPRHEQLLQKTHGL